MMISNSMRLSFTGLHVGCTTKTSHPLTFSLIITLISSFENLPTSIAPSGTPICLQMLDASFLLEFPEKILRSWPPYPYNRVTPYFSCFLRFDTQPSLLVCRCLAIPKEPSGTSEVIVDPAATKASFPILKGAMILALQPTNAPSSMIV